MSDVKKHSSKKTKKDNEHISDGEPTLTTPKKTKTADNTSSSNTANTTPTTTTTTTTSTPVDQATDGKKAKKHSGKDKTTDGKKVSIVSILLYSHIDIGRRCCTSKRPEWCSDYTNTTGQSTSSKYCRLCVKSVAKSCLTIQPITC